MLLEGENLVEIKLQYYLLVKDSPFKIISGNLLLHSRIRGILHLSL